jgi:hypothetical protein
MLLLLQLRQTTQRASLQRRMLQQAAPIRTARAQSKLRHPWWPPSQPNPWWRCAATTDLAKSAPKRLLGAMGVEMAALASVVRAQVATAAQVPAALVIGVLNAEVIVLVTEPRVKTAARVWVMRLSAPSAKPWSAPKCRCASWLRKHTARPWAVS